jgi:hypothetical protein
MGDESKALQDQHADAEAAEIVRTVALAVRTERYDAAKAAAVGTTIACPWCGKRFGKRSYQQVFCSNKGRGNCKDSYHNQATPERLERARAWADGTS